MFEKITSHEKTLLSHNVCFWDSPPKIDPTVTVPSLFSTFTIFVIYPKVDFTMSSTFVLLLSVLLLAVNALEPRGHLPSGYVKIRITGRYPATFKVDYSSELTGIQLAQKVADELGGVEAQFVTLFKLDRPLKLMGPSGPAFNLDRSPDNRIDNSNQTLGQLKVKSRDTIQCLLRPLRGDHIHYAFAIYYKGELVDMSLIEDRPVLAVQNNMKVGESYDKCSPVEPGTAGTSAPPFDIQATVPGMDNLPRFLGPRIWEGGHIDHVFPHFGVHFGHAHWFGFGLIHVHPATSWNFFEETEGLGANLDAALEQVGIWIWEKNSRRYPYHSAIGFITDDNKLIMDFPNVGILKTVNGTELTSNLNWSFCDYPTNRLLIGNDDKYVWRLYYHRNAMDNEDFTVMEENFGRVWLRHNMGFLALSYEERGANAATPVPAVESLEYLFNDNSRFKMSNPVTGEVPQYIPSDASTFQAMGFDGEPYPAPYKH
jgi:hypothetical protein